VERPVVHRLRIPVGYCPYRTLPRVEIAGEVVVDRICFECDAGSNRWGEPKALAAAHMYGQMRISALFWWWLSRITLLLPRAEFERFDSYCRQRGFKKSPLIARLIREHLDRESFFVQPVLNIDPATSADRKRRS